MGPALWRRLPGGDPSARRIGRSRLTALLDGGTTIRGERSTPWSSQHPSERLLCTCAAEQRRPFPGKKRPAHSARSSLPRSPVAQSRHPAPARADESVPADISFVFSQRDAMDLARQAGTKVMLDFQSCWYERDLEQTVRRNIDVVGITQLSDYVLGTPGTGNRAVPGDGAIPLERLVAMVLDAGFEGSFDLEIMGPRIEDEGYLSAGRVCRTRQ